jgi:hypothetical protein
MKRISLTQGKYALVDDSDYEWLNQYKWYAIKDYNTWYAVRHITKPDGKQTLISMHRFILGLEYGDLREGDHKNHNGLDNRQDNLRICTGSQNQYNANPHKNCSSVFKGIYWNKISNKWHTRISIRGQQRNLGYFNNEIKAAKAYDEAARKYFGEFANLNFR